MADENATACTNCGAPLKEGAAFCTKCGAAAATTASPPAPPGPPIPPTAAPMAGGEVPTAPMPAAYPQAGVAPMAPPKRSKAPLIIGIFGGLLVIGGIVVLILFLTVWKGGSSGGTGTPQALAEKYMSAMEKGDATAYMDCFEPDYFTSQGGQIMEDMGIDIKKMLEMSFEYIEVKFDGVKLDVESETGSKAVVVTTAGTVDLSFMGMGDTLDLAKEPLEFNMVKNNGRWYLAEDPMPTDLGVDGSFDSLDNEDFNLDDMNLEDLENLLPEELNLEDLQDLLPEDINLDDLQNMDQQDLDQLFKELEQWMQQEGIPQDGTTSGPV